MSLLLFLVSLPCSLAASTHIDSSQNPTAGSALRSTESPSMQLMELASKNGKLVSSAENARKELAAVKAEISKRLSLFHGNMAKLAAKEKSLISAVEDAGKEATVVKAEIVALATEHKVEHEMEAKSAGQSHPERAVLFGNTPNTNISLEFWRNVKNAVTNAARGVGNTASNVVQEVSGVVQEVSSVVQEVSSVVQEEGVCGLIEDMLQEMPGTIDAIISRASQSATELLQNLQSDGCEGLLMTGLMNDKLKNADFCMTPAFGPFNKTISLPMPAWAANHTSEVKVNMTVCFAIASIKFDETACNNLATDVSEHTQTWIDQKISEPVTDGVNSLLEFVGCAPDQSARRLEVEEERGNPIHNTVVASVGEIFNERLIEKRVLLERLPKQMSTARGRMVKELVALDENDVKKVAVHAYNKLLDKLGGAIADGYAKHWYVHDEQGRRRLEPNCLQNSDLLCSASAIMPRETVLSVSLDAALEYVYAATSAFDEMWHIDLMTLNKQTSSLFNKMDPVPFDFVYAIFAGVAIKMTITLALEAPFTARLMFEDGAIVSGSVTLSDFRAIINITGNGVDYNQASGGTVCATFQERSTRSAMVAVSSSLGIHIHLVFEGALAILLWKYGFEGTASIEAAVGLDTVLCGGEGVCPALTSKTTSYAEYDMADTTATQMDGGTISTGAWAYATYPVLSLALKYPGSEGRGDETLGFNSNFDGTIDDGLGAQHPYGMMVRIAEVLGTHQLGSFEKCSTTILGNLFSAAKSLTSSSTVEAKFNGRKVSTA